MPMLSLSRQRTEDGTICDAQRGGDLGRKVDVAGRVDQVDEEVQSVAVLQPLHLVLRHLVVQRDACGIELGMFKGGP